MFIYPAVLFKKLEATIKYWWLAPPCKNSTSYSLLSRPVISRAKSFALLIISENFLLLWDISNMDKPIPSNSLMASEDFLKTTFGSAEGPALKFIFFIIKN